MNVETWQEQLRQINQQILLQWSHVRMNVETARKLKASNKRLGTLDASG